MSLHRLRAATLLCASILASGFPPPGDAQTVTREATISGMGLRRCSEWQQWKEVRNGEARAMALEWTQGFIAGHNVYARNTAGSGKSVVVDVKALIPLMDSFCGKDPEARILSVVIQITQSLGGEKVKLEPKAPAQKSPQRVQPQPDTPT